MKSPQSIRCTCICGMPEQTKNPPKLRWWTWEQLQTWGLLYVTDWFLVLCLSQFCIQSLLSLVDWFIDLVALFLFFKYIDIYIFFLFLFFVSVYVYTSLRDFVCIALLLPFVLGFCLSFSFFLVVIRDCYHWWICFLVWLLSSFFIFSFFIAFYFFIFNFYFNNSTSFYLFFSFLLFFSLFS